MVHLVPRPSLDFDKLNQRLGGDVKHEQNVVRTHAGFDRPFDRLRTNLTGVGGRCFSREPQRLCHCERRCSFPSVAIPKVAFLTTGIGDCHIALSGPS